MQKQTLYTTAEKSLRKRISQPTRIQPAQLTPVTGVDNQENPNLVYPDLVPDSQRTMSQAFDVTAESLSTRF